ncbi:MAG: ABC transporter permease [Armatimonadetes bacterium]|nr:ABC transporter permease [Armatimonadota bacterium]
MLDYVRGRVVAAVPVLLGISLLAFLMLYLLPGDPVLVMLGEASLTPEQVETLRRQLGLDAPLPVQYVRYLGRMLVGDFGRSIRNQVPVIDQMAEQLPSTLELSVAGIVLATAGGVFLGLVAATHHNRWMDTVSMVLALVGVSTPSFAVGLLLIFAFALNLGWFPATGQGGLLRLVLPAVTLGAFGMGIIARLVRASMLEVLLADFVRTARAKGLPRSAVLVRHALKNALIPVVTIVGLQFGRLLSGTVVVETVFSRQGIGRLLVDSILGKDFPLVQGLVVLNAAIYVTVNLLVDISYALVDPRIRYG